MILRDSKRGPFLGCSTFPKCRSTKMMKKLEGADLKQVEALIPLLKKAPPKPRTWSPRSSAKTPPPRAR